MLHSVVVIYFYIMCCNVLLDSFKNDRFCPQLRLLKVCAKSLGTMSLFDCRPFLLCCSIVFVYNQSYCLVWRINVFIKTLGNRAVLGLLGELIGNISIVADGVPLYI